MKNFIFLAFIFGLFAVDSSESLKCKCRLGVDKRIIGGHKADRNFIPWHVSLALKNGDHYCGGFIVNENYIITSGGCLLNKTVDDFEIRVGLYRLNDTNKLVYKASELFIEPSFVENQKKKSYEGDVALIKLNESIQFIDNRVEPACLNLEKANKSEFDVLMSVGYGSFEPTWKYKNKIILRGFPSKDLKYAYFYEDMFCVSYFICLKPVNEGDLTCSFDEGGPLSRLKLRGIIDVEGVHSHLIGKTDENNKYLANACSGSIYTRLSSFRSFIEKHIGESYCKLKGSHPIY